MKINSTKDAGKLTMSISGRLDTSTAPELEAEVRSQIGDVTEFVIDLAELEYISSAGLRVLLSAQKIMNKQGSMKLINVQDTIMEIFEITGFTDILTIE